MLWLLIPLGVIAWLIGTPWFLDRNVSFGQFLGWLDFNLCIALQRGPLRPFVAKPRIEWISVTKMADTEHRVRFLPDLW